MSTAYVHIATPLCQSHHKLIYALSVRHAAAVVQKDTKNDFLSQPAQLYWQTNLFCLQYTATCFGIYTKAVVRLNRSISIVKKAFLVSYWTTAACRTLGA